MKKVLLLALVIVASASLASAQTGNGGQIGLFSDMGGTNCFLVDAGPGLAPVYSVHTLSPGATASQFMVVNHGFTGSNVGESAATGMLAQGAAFTGLAVAYGGPCIIGSAQIYMINFFTSGTSAPCSWMEVVPDPIAPTGTIEIADCQVPPTKLVGTGGQLVVNPDGTCECANPVEETSWGKIKSLYGE